MPVVPPGNIQFTTIGKQPSLLKRMSGFSIPLGPVVDEEDVSAAPSSPPGSPSPQARTTSLGRLASLVNTGELASSSPATAATAVAPVPQTAITAGTSTSASSIFNLPAEIFKTAPKPPIASTPSVPTSFYFRPAASASTTSPSPAGPSVAPARVAYSQPTPVTTATPARPPIPNPEKAHIDAPSRPPEPATPLHAGATATSPASAPSESSRLAEALRDSRIELDDLRRTRDRVRDEFQEFRHRWQETEHALERQKAQMERLVAVCEEWFDKEERVHERRELRLAADHARLAGLEEEERMREAERVEAEERTRLEAEEAQRREEERALAEEQAVAEAEAQRRRAEEKRELEAQLAAERRRAEEEAKTREEEAKQRKAALAKAEAQEQARRALENKQRDEEEERARRETEERKKREEAEAKSKAAREAQERLKAEKYKAAEEARMKAVEEKARREAAGAMAERAQYATRSPRLSYQTAPSTVEAASPSPEVVAALSLFAPQEAVSRAFASPSGQRVSPYNPSDAPRMAPGALQYPQDEIRTQANAAPFFEVRQSVSHSNPALAASPPAMTESVSATVGRSSGPADAPRISADMQDRLTGTLAANSAPSSGSSHLPSSAAAPAPADMSLVAQKPPSRGTPKIVRNRWTLSSEGSPEERKPVVPSQDMPPPRASPAQPSTSEQAPMSSQASSASQSAKSGKKKKSAVSVKPEPSPSPTTESAPTLPPPPAARESVSRPPAVVHALPPKPPAPNPQVRKGQALSKPREQMRMNANGDRPAVRPPSLEARNSPGAHSAPAAPQLPGDRFVTADQHVVAPPAHVRVEPLADRLNYVPMHGGFDDDGMVVSARDDSPYRAYTPPRAPSPPVPRGRGDHYSPSPIRASRSRERRYSPSPARSPERSYTPPRSPYREPPSPNRKRFRDDDRDLPPARRPRYDDRPPPHPLREPTPPLPPPARFHGDSYRPDPRDVRRVSPPPSYSAVMSSRVPQDPPPRTEPRTGGQPRRAGPSNARPESMYVPAMPPPPVAPLSARIGNAAPQQDRAPVPRQDHGDLMSRLSDPRPQPRNGGPRPKSSRAPADEPPPRRGRPQNPVQTPRKGRGGATYQESRSGKGPLESRLS